jgi:FkbM family methyltransferase
MDLSWLKRPYPALIDIGANDGAFAAYLCRTFAIEVVHAFEPLARHSEALRARGYNVHQLALSDADGEADLVVTEYDPASSLRVPTQQCLDEFPVVREAGKEKVQVRRLDSVLSPISGALMKVDAQGEEARIISGGQNVFAAASVVLIEMTFVPLYEGGSLFNEVHTELAALGFSLAGFRGQTLSETTKRPLFAHCIYTRE